MTGLRTNYHCPACLKRLRFVVEDNTILVWCANARCPSDVARTGTKSVNEEPNEMAKRLVGYIEEE